MHQKSCPELAPVYKVGQAPCGTRMGFPLPQGKAAHCSANGERYEDTLRWDLKGGPMAAKGPGSDVIGHLFPDLNAIA